MVAVTLTAACIRLPCGWWGRKNTGKNLVCWSAGVKYTAHLENCFADYGQNIEEEKRQFTKHIDNYNVKEGLSANCMVNP